MLPEIPIQPTFGCPHVLSCEAVQAVIYCSFAGAEEVQEKKAIRRSDHRGFPEEDQNCMWGCLKMGYIPNEIAIFHRDNDH